MTSTQALQDYREESDRQLNHVEQLAKHKGPWISHNTCLRPQVMWGTQDMLYPVSPRALNSTASDRVGTLAKPKKDFQKGTMQACRPLYYYGAGRPSMIWGVAPGAKTASCTDRIASLARHKQFHPEWEPVRSQFYYSCGRESPIWKVEQSSMQSKERPRTITLARPKECNSDFQGERPVQSIVSSAACSAVASNHVATLALPKIRQEGPFREPQWPVSKGAKSSVASERCTELAIPKSLADGYKFPKPVAWPVSKAARRAVISGRVDELARPIIRSL